jgi:hypothetical protein
MHKKKKNTATSSGVPANTSSTIIKNKHLELSPAEGKGSVPYRK